MIKQMCPKKAIITDVCVDAFKACIFVSGSRYGVLRVWFNAEVNKN